MPGQQWRRQQKTVSKDYAARHLGEKQQEQTPAFVLKPLLFTVSFTLQSLAFIIYFIDFRFYFIDWRHALMFPKSKPLTDFISTTSLTTCRGCYMESCLGGCQLFHPAYSTHQS